MWQFVLSLLAAFLVGMVALVSLVLVIPKENTYTQAEIDNIQKKLDDETSRANKAEKQYKALKELNQLLTDNGGSDSSSENQDDGSGTDSQNRNKLAGETETNGALSMTFKSMNEPGSVPQEWNGQQPNLTPSSGTKFLSIQVAVKNNSKEPIDLTCGYPLEIKAMNESDQLYTPIDDLFKIPGNPGCNDMLQPGITASISYVFNVPSDAKMIGFVWRDRTDLAAQNKYATFVFKKGYSIQ